MKSNIADLCKFASRYFDVEENEIYSHSRTGNCVNAKHIIWYHLHVEDGMSVGKLAQEFFKTRRTIFMGISKIRNGIKTQRYYRDLYNNFITEYKKAAR